MTLDELMLLADEYADAAVGFIATNEPSTRQRLALFKALKELARDADRLRKVCMVIDRHWNTFSAPCCVAFNEAMKGEQP